MNNPAPRWAKTLFLLLLTLAAFGLRFYRVGSISLAEDEAGKWLSIQQFKHGHFIGVNSEHPILMKLLVWASLDIGEQWNRWAGGRHWPQAREETILRMPNLLFGAATTIVIYLLGKEMLSVVGAASAAFFWAFAPMSIALNRIVKEDSLVTFLSFLGVYFFFLGKRTPEDARAGQYFTLSGAFFGLAVASKYYLHFLGLNVVIWHIAGKAGLDHRPFLKPFGKRFWGVMGLAFVIANPVILWPTQIVNILRFTGEMTLLHHGYNLNGHLYMNTITSTPFGVPWYFYFWVMGVKTPLPILLAMVAGFVLVLMDARSMAAIFLRVMVVLSFLLLAVFGPKSIRYLLQVLPSVFLLAGYAVETLYNWLARLEPAALRGLGMALAAMVLFAWPAAETLAWAPLYPLYLNQFGGGRANAAKFFPHDELYDLGVREGVEYVCEVAPRGAVLAVSNPMVAGYYLEKCGRADIDIRKLFDLQYAMRPGDFVLLQQSRRYFETEPLLDLIARHAHPLKEVWVDGVVTARIYRF